MADTKIDKYRRIIFDRFGDSGVITIAKTERRDRKEWPGFVPSMIEDFFSKDTFDHFWLARKLNPETDCLDWHLAIRAKRGAISSSMEVVPAYELFNEEEQKDPNIVFFMPIEHDEMTRGYDTLEVCDRRSIEAFKASYDAQNLYDLTYSD